MPRDFFVFQQLQQLFGGGGAAAWLQVATLLGLLAALLYRPERIRMPVLFRVACVLLALSVLAGPTITGMLMFLQGLDSGGFRPGRGSDDLWMALGPLVNAAGPVLLGTSILLALIAVSPKPRRPGDPPQPPRHPLD
jgi:hypothetical protein